MKSINEGDFVQVDFNGAQITMSRCAEVVGIPCATGDSWKVIPTETGKLTYISEGCTLTVVDKPDAQPAEQPSDTCKWKRAMTKTGALAGAIESPHDKTFSIDIRKDCPTCGKRIEVVE